MDDNIPNYKPDYFQLFKLIPNNSQLKFILRAKGTVHYQINTISNQLDMIKAIADMGSASLKFEWNSSDDKAYFMTPKDQLFVNVSIRLKDYDKPEENIDWVQFIALNDVDKSSPLYGIQSIVRSHTKGGRITGQSSTIVPYEADYLFFGNCTITD
ncbi:hypothetical protein BC833DRAFT_590513 [Globomyces pollinis-pini]|nr:hypothetical protein BC833DRAFT_590513 [Globomyces pollinis-pini]